MSLKKVLKFLVAFTLIYFLPSLLFSDDIKDAEQYYSRLDYKYALEIYEKIMRTNPKMEIAERIANCYRFINNTEAAEVWYLKTVSYPSAPAEVYKYLADAQKQNGKFDEASDNYLYWGEKIPAKLVEATVFANSCSVAKVWVENPDIGALVENEIRMNTENSDFCPTYIGDNILLVSDRWETKAKTDKKAKTKVNEVYGWTGNPFLKVYEFEKRTGKLTLFDKKINFGYHNGPVAVNKTLDTLIFTRSILPSKHAPKDDNGKKYLLIAVKEGAAWNVKERIPFNVDGKFSVQHPALSPNGQTLYFASDMPGSLGKMDLYFSEKQDNGSWSAPLNCGKNINTAEDDVFPSVRSDGKFFFSSKGHIGMGGLDLFSSSGEKANFTQAENLRAPLNSPKDDFGITFNQLTTNKGYLSSNRSGGVGLDDIYRFQLGIKAEPKAKDKLFALNGAVVEKGTSLPIEGMKVVLFNKNTGKEETALSDASGKFKFSLLSETDYLVKGDLEKFFTTQEGNISTKGVNQSTIYDIKFELERSKDAFTVRLNNIYYNYNKSNIRNDAFGDLNKISVFMASMPNVKLEMTAHTDARGRAAYNQALSENRATSAKDYLVSKGISKYRLASFGKGETELLNQCSDGVKCTEAQHQLNRRTEFKILKVTPTAAIFTTKHLLAKGR